MPMIEGWEVGADYECLRVLGKGGYGQVCEAIHKPSGKRVAIKRMDNIFCNRHHARRILREIVILRKLRHQYVIDLFDIIEPEDQDNFSSVYIVLELADRDMRKLIESDTFLTLDHIKSIVYKMLCSIKFMHSAKIIHRDIKPANILIQNSFDEQTKKPIDPKDWKIKICDFGLARSLVGVSSTKLIMNTLGQMSESHHHEHEDLDTSYSSSHADSHHSSATHQHE